MSFGECTARLRCSDLSEGVRPFREGRAMRGSILLCWAASRCVRVGITTGDEGVVGLEVSEPPPSTV